MILVAVLCSIVIAEIVILLPALFLWHRDELAKLQDQTLRLLKANVEVTAFPTIADTVRIGERIATFSAVRGGSITNAVGEEVAVFGQRPTLSFHRIRREGVRAELSVDRAFLDVFYPPEETGLANPVTLRIDATGVPRALFARLSEMALFVLGIGLVTALVVALILSVWIVRPLIRLRDAATAATDNPDRADNYHLRWQRDDELGEAARAFDLLLTAVSIVHQEDLAANQEAMQVSAYAHLAYDPSGRLMSANPAALKLFGADTTEELALRDVAYVRMKTTGGTMDLSPMEMLSKGDVEQSVGVVTPKALKKCHMNATVIRKRNGSVLRYAVTLLDMTKQVSYAEHLESECARVNDEAAGLRRRVAEMRGMFEGCLSIFASVGSLPTPAAPNPVPPDAPTVATDRVVNAWFADALKAGMVKARLEHGALPFTKGDPDLVAGVFRQALMTVYARAVTDRPVIDVNATRLGDGTARFEVLEASSARVVDPRKNTAELASAAAITTMGLSQALNRAGGRLLPKEPGDSRNVVTFTLMVAAPQQTVTYEEPETFAEPNKLKLRGLRG